jgi:hypothetical protein
MRCFHTEPLLPGAAPRKKLTPLYRTSQVIGCSNKIAKGLPEKSFELSVLLLQRENVV